MDPIPEAPDEAAWLCRRLLLRLERLSVSSPCRLPDGLHAPLEDTAGEHPKRSDGTLVRSLLQARGSYSHEDLIHRRLLLAAEAAEGAAIDRATMDDLARRLVEVQTSRIRLVRKAAMSGLARLSRAGHDGARRWIEERIRRKEHVWLDETAESIGEAVVGEAGASVRQAMRSAWLDDPKWFYVRRMAVELLAPLIPVIPDLRRPILDRLDDCDIVVRHAAIERLGALAAHDSALRRALGDRLNEPDRLVYETLIETLSPFVEHDPRLRRLVLERMEDESLGVRRAAVAALGPLAARDPDARRILIEKSKASDWGVREGAIRALSPPRPGDLELRRVFLARLEDPIASIRAAAVRALSTMVSVDPEVRRLVMGRLGDDRDDVRESVIHALSPRISADPEARRLVLAAVDDSAEKVRRAAIEAMIPWVATDPALLRFAADRMDDLNWRTPPVDFHEILRPMCDGSPKLGEPTPRTTGDDERHAPLAMATRRGAIEGLDAEDDSVRADAIRALAPFATSDPELRRLVLERLSDPDWGVAMRAVEALAPLAASDPEIGRRVVPWLGVTGTRDQPPISGACFTSAHFRQQLAQVLGPLLGRSPALLDQVAALLHAPSWRARAGAAKAILAIPHGAPAALVPQLRGLLTDRRWEEGWPERLQFASILLHGPDPALRRRALEVTLDALDYAIAPWYERAAAGVDVRQQAAGLLGGLDPAHRDEVIVQRLIRFIREEGYLGGTDMAYLSVMRLSAPSSR